MEKLKSLITNDLKQMISETTPENLTLTCSLLLEFLSPLPHFQRVLGELTDPEMALCRKSKESALDSKRKGNECFSKGDYVTALSFYSQALRYAPMNSDGMDKHLVATLYVNRASTMHKMGLIEECIRDCNRAIVLSALYVKAWFRRGKANAALKNYEDAIHDLEVALSMEGSSSAKSHINEELDILLSHFNRTCRTNNSCNSDKDKNLASSVEPHHVELQCVSTPSKGRGMTSPNDIPPASLIHCEEPFAAIVSKSCRETHCHFCLNEVPADVLFCPSCTIPLYCSQHCQEQAGGEQCDRNQSNYSAHKNLSEDLEKHVRDTFAANSIKHPATSINFKDIPEHRHECGGVHWPAVLPVDIVLAGRVMVKSIERRRFSGEISKPMESSELAHHYFQMPPDSKLELHIYAVVLACCLKNYCCSDFPLSGASVSQLVILASQIKVNSMAVVHMKSLDGYGAMKKAAKLSAIGNGLTCSVQQVRVGQAIYSTGSLFNHSCQPNIHAYFLSRTLFLRSTEFVPAGYPLELSYGPQGGQWDLQDRQELLKEQYSFICHCTDCSELNLSDLVINAFRCVESNCLGAVLEMARYDKLEDDFLQVSGPGYGCKLSLPVSKQKKDIISKVAYRLLQRTGVIRHIGPGDCLSCGAHYDLECSRSASKKDMIDIERLKDLIISSEVPDTILSDTLKSLSHLRSIRHPYSKIVAQAEDIIAEAFFMIGEFEPAMQHCKASIEILEKLYHTKHIVIGNELLKVASIQLSLGDRPSALNSVKRLETILSLYYGSHVAKIYPYLGSLRREADRLPT